MQIGATALGSCSFKYKIQNDSPFEELYVSTNRNINSAQIVSQAILENSPDVKRIKKGHKAQFQAQAAFIYTPITDVRGKNDRSGRFEQKWMVQSLACAPSIDQAKPVVAVDIKYTEIENNALDKRIFAIKQLKTSTAQSEHSITKQHAAQPSYWTAPDGYGQVIP